MILEVICVQQKENGGIEMKYTLNEAIRKLQKEGFYRFEGLSREESRKAASALAKAAMDEDRKYGITSCFGIARDAFGYYHAVSIEN